MLENVGKFGKITNVSMPSSPPPPPPPQPGQAITGTRVDEPSVAVVVIQKSELQFSFVVKMVVKPEGTVVTVDVGAKELELEPDSNRVGPGSVIIDRLLLDELCGTAKKLEVALLECDMSDDKNDDRDVCNCDVSNGISFEIQEQ